MKKIINCIVGCVFASGALGADATIYFQNTGSAQNPRYSITKIVGSGIVEVPTITGGLEEGIYVGNARVSGIYVHCQIDPRITTLALPTNELKMSAHALSYATNVTDLVIRGKYGYPNSYGLNGVLVFVSHNYCFRGMTSLKSAWIETAFVPDPSYDSSNTDDIGETGLCESADSIHIQEEYQTLWLKYLRNTGYGGKVFVYSGKWPNVQEREVEGGARGVVSIVTNYVHVIVTNVVEHQHYTTVTNVVRYVPEPGTSPAPAYCLEAGAAGDLKIEGAAGWDAYGLPDGMTWNREGGVLSGAANKSGVYDLLLVSGSGTDTKIMRTSLEVKGYATLVGHVGVAFSKSGAPVNCLKSYKTLPSGLKWDSKKQVLSGIPTKAQTLSYETVYGDPVTIDIKSAATTLAGTYNGLIGSRVGEEQGDSWLAFGNLTLTVAATGKISAKVVVPQGTYTFSATAWDSVADGVYRVDMATKAGDTLCVALDTTKDWRGDRLVSPTSFRIAQNEAAYDALAWRNEHGKADAIAQDAVASEFIARIKAQKKIYLKATKEGDSHYVLESQAVAKGADVTLTFNANGTVAYSGKVDGTKVSGSSTLAVADDSYTTIFDLVVPVSKTRAMHFAMGFKRGEDGAPIPDFEVIVSDMP